MINLIGNIIQLIVYILTWRLGVADREFKENERLSLEASNAIKSGRVSLINAVVGKLRNKKANRNYIDF